MDPEIVTEVITRAVLLNGVLTTGVCTTGFFPDGATAWAIPGRNTVPNNEAVTIRVEAIPMCNFFVLKTMITPTLYLVCGNSTLA